MGQTRVDQDFHVNGTLTAKVFNPPASCITNASIITGAGIDTSKMDHRHRKDVSQVGTVADETRSIYIARAAGEVRSFEASLAGACVGGATVTLDLQKSTGGGAFASILSAPISFSNADAARSVKAGTISSGAFVDGDVFQVVVDATTGGGTVGTGLIGDAEFDEEAS